MEDNMNKSDKEMAIALSFMARIYKQKQEKMEEKEKSQEIRENIKSEIFKSDYELSLEASKLYVKQYIEDLPKILLQLNPEDRKDAIRRKLESKFMQFGEEMAERQLDECKKVFKKHGIDFPYIENICQDNLPF